MKLMGLCLAMAGIFPAGVLPLHGGELWVGAAQVDITPDRPVALAGGMTAPISKGVNSPVTAGKGYSAIPQSCSVGPEGGQLLVERTVQGLQSVMGEERPAQ